MQSLAHQFLEFCRSKPADEGYDYTDCVRCACGQFASSLGWNGNDIDSLRVACEPTEMTVLAAETPKTFGALATRLEAALTEQVS